MPGTTDPATGSTLEAEIAAAKNGKAEMKEFADRRLAAMAKPSGSTGADNQGAGAPAPRTPDGKFATKENTPAAPATPDKAKEVPNGAKPADREFLSDFDEEFRKSFDALSPESQERNLKVLAAEGRKERDYRQKTMSVKDREKALAAEEETLRFGRAIRRDPELLDTVQAKIDQRTGKAPAAKPVPFDYITATPEEIQAHEAANRKLASDDAYDRFKRDEEAKEQAQSEKVAMAVAAKAAFVDTGDYEPEVVNDLYERLKAVGSKFTKDNVVEILRGFLPPPKAKGQPAKDNLIPAASTPVQASGASSLARAGGVTPLVTTPPFIQQGKTPTVANDLTERQKRIQEAVWQVNKRHEAQGKDLISLGSPS